VYSLSSNPSQSANLCSRCAGQIERVRFRGRKVPLIRFNVPGFCIERGDNVESGVLETQRHSSDAGEKINGDRQWPLDRHRQSFDRIYRSCGYSNPRKEGLWAYILAARGLSSQHAMQTERVLV